MVKYERVCLKLVRHTLLFRADVAAPSSTGKRCINLLSRSLCGSLSRSLNSSAVSLYNSLLNNGSLFYYLSLSSCALLGAAIVGVNPVATTCYDCDNYQPSQDFLHSCKY